MFDIQGWSCFGRFTTSQKPVFFTYDVDNIIAGNTDTLATIATSAYFNDVASFISQNDLVYVVASDGVGLYRFTSADGESPVTVTAFDTVPSGSIVNADISASAAIAFSKLAALTSANILVGNGSNVPAAVAVTGDIGISNAGVTSIAAGAIVNADVNASAAIDFSKLAALPSAQILVGNGSNTAAAVALSGDATISNAGALTVANTAITPAKINTAGNSRIVSLPVSFEAAQQGTLTVYFNCAATVNTVRSQVTDALANTDAGTITCQNNAGSAMAGGVITIPLSSAVATENSATPTTNNTFTSGQKMQLVVAKTTPGGAATVFIEYTVTG